jgi:hypothetical protein
LIERILLHPGSWWIRRINALERKTGVRQGIGRDAFGATAHMQADAGRAQRRASASSADAGSERRPDALRSRWPSSATMIHHLPAKCKNSHRIFISYAQEDTAIARQLAKTLREADFEPWFDQEALSPGDNWATESGRAIEASYAIVFLISKESLRSKWPQNEWNFALGSRKHAGRVLPVLTPGTSMDEVPWILKHIQHLKSGADWKKTTRQVAETLRELEDSP